MNRRVQALPAADDFLEVLDENKTQHYVEEIKEKMKNGMSVLELTQEIQFLQRERQVRRQPFKNQEDFADFANKMHAYTTCLTMALYTPVGFEES